MIDLASIVPSRFASSTHGHNAGSTPSRDEKVQYATRHSPLALVVEDEALVAEFLASILEEMGLRVAKADTVATALQHARGRDRFAVVFVDLGLPDRSGLELIEELQRVQPGVPIVISTGYRTVLQRDMAEGNSIPHYLAKPYNTQAIAEVLLEVGLQAKLPPLNSFGALAFRMDGVRRRIEVMHGPRGYYLGTTTDGKPFSRESAESWNTQEDAERALAQGEWTQRLAD